MINLLNISAQHNVSPFADIIIVNASRSEVKEGALAPSNHSLCICEDQELLLSSSCLSHFKLRHCLCFLIDLFCLLSPASLFSLVDCCYQWIEGKQEDMCVLFVMHKQEVARLGELGMVVVVGGKGGVCTNQHPCPLSHANEALGISRTLLLP